MRISDWSSDVCSSDLFYDWPSALVSDMETHDPELAIIMFGGNDAQGIVGPDGTVYSSVSETGWQAEYGRRVGAVMDSLQGGGRLVLWVGQPPMRDAGFDDRVELLDRKSTRLNSRHYC